MITILARKFYLTRPMLYLLTIIFESYSILCGKYQKALVKFKCSKKNPYEHGC